MYNSAENSSILLNLHLAWGLYYKHHVYHGFIVVLLVYEIN